MKGGIEQINTGQVITHMCLLPIRINQSVDCLQEKEDLLDCMNENFEQIRRLDVDMMFTRSV